MSKGPRAGRFETQLRLVLILIVLFLAVLDLLNIALLSRARDTAERSERERAKARGREAARVLDPEALTSERGSALRTSLTQDALARMAHQFDLSRVAVLDARGRETVASGPGAGYAATFLDLDASEREALTAGRAVASAMAPRSGGEGALVGAFVPVLDASGRLAAVVEVQQAVPELGGLHRAFRLLVATQAAGVVLIGVVVLAFGRWVSRPFRRLAAAVGEAGLQARGASGADDPDDLAAAFRAVAHKMRDQDEALDALGRGGGGLADLARFAAGAARGMTTGVLVVDRRGRIAAANPAAETLLGVTGGASRGADLSTIGRGLEALRDLVRGCLDSGRSVSREVIELRGERGPGHLGVTISPAVGTGAEPGGVLVLMTDLTEIRRVQEQVRLRDNLAAVGHLSAGIAHEFRNALGTILGYARMLEKRDDPRVHGPAREIVKEVDAVRAHIDEFLLYARPPEPQRSPVDVGELVRACASHPPPGLHVEVGGEYGVITADEGLLRRVFVNLLQNAADAGEEAGRVPSVRITGRRAGRTLQVEVEDDGPGIPVEKRGQIFLPFFTTRARGTGLGLALVQRTLVDLGGSVEAGEGPRGGAAFRLRLPLAQILQPADLVTNRDTSSLRRESDPRGAGKRES